MIKQIGLFLGAALVLLSCSSKTPDHIAFNRCEARYHYYDQTNYDIKPNATTNTNIVVDTSGLSININKIDRLTTETENCLIKTFGNPPLIPDETVKAAQCVSNTFELPLRRNCLVVKVANNWFLSTYDYGGTKHQQLPYTNGGQCTAKGLPAGVCYYRVGIQDDLTIVVPPSFYLYKDALVRISTGCGNPWMSEQLSACMEPTTNPLDDGSQP
jgi:hypothetical protein